MSLDEQAGDEEEAHRRPRRYMVGTWAPVLAEGGRGQHQNGSVGSA